MNIERNNKLIETASAQMYLADRLAGLRCEKQEAFHHSTRLCGYRFDPLRPWLTHHCRKATCSACNKRWSKNLAERFVAECENPDTDGYYMVTLMFDLQHSVEDCFDLFAAKRTQIRRSISKARELKRDSLSAQRWRDVVIAGSLEIDMFHGNDYHRLGSRKCESYREDFDFDPVLCRDQNVFVPHFHAIVHLGSLPVETFETRLKTFCRVVHIQPLAEGQTVMQAASNILGYACKTWFETTYKDYRKVNWKIAEVIEFIDALLHRQGRKAFKFELKRYKNKTDIPMLDKQG